jgi:hypothetical protein
VGGAQRRERGDKRDNKECTKWGRTEEGMKRKKESYKVVGGEEKIGGIKKWDEWGGGGGSTEEGWEG